MNKIALTLTVFIILVGCDQQPAESNAQQPPPQVEYAQPLVKAITQWDEYSGRFEAVNNVNVRSRVTGYLTETLFEDGDFVEKDQVLFVIDPRTFEYAEARAKAQYALAEKEYNRANKLGRSSAISQEDIDRRFQELQAADALLKQARLDLQFTEVKSPISGKVSRDFVNVGNLVRADDTILTRVVSTDPMHFYFDASQQELLKYLRLDRAGKRPSSDYAPNPIFIKLQDEDKYVHQGYMDFVDNVVDANTGTIQGRALLPNPDTIISSGMFGQARLLGSEITAIMVPDSAINTEQSRKFVYTINEDDTVSRTYVTLGAVRDSGLYIVESGLTGEEKVVINGLQRIRAPQQKVTPVEKTISEDEVDSKILPREQWLDFGQTVRTGAQQKTKQPAAEETPKQTPKNNNDGEE